MERERNAKWREVMGTSPPKSCDFNPQESSESDDEIQGFRIKVYFKVSENSEIPYFHNLNLFTSHAGAGFCENFRWYSCLLNDNPRAFFCEK